jgi:hypothetical protein
MRSRQERKATVKEHQVYSLTSFSLSQTASRKQADDSSKQDSMATKARQL